MSDYSIIIIITIIMKKAHAYTSAPRDLIIQFMVYLIIYKNTSTLSFSTSLFLLIFLPVTVAKPLLALLDRN